MPLLRPYCELMCVWNIGLYVAAVQSVIRFPVYALHYREKVLCFDFMPLTRGGATPKGLRREDMDAVSHTHTHIRGTIRTTENNWHRF